MDRKIDKMHRLFGRAWGEKCANCQHLQGGVNQYRKCEVYGESASEATDWALKWDACGLFNKPYKGDVPIVNLNKGGRKAAEVQIKGQMSLFGGGNG